MYVYCGNNPINRIDPTGMFWKKIGKFFTNTWESLKTILSKICGSENSIVDTVVEESAKIDKFNKMPLTIKGGAKTTTIISKSGDSSKPISVYTSQDIKNPLKSSSAGIKLNISKITLDTRVALDDIGTSYSITNENSIHSLELKLNLSEFKIGLEYSIATEQNDEINTTYTNININGLVFVATYVYIKTGQIIPIPAYA